MIPYTTITPPADLAEALAWLRILAPYLLSQDCPGTADVLQAEKRVRLELERREREAGR
jgi:hypothetical protein